MSDTADAGQALQAVAKVCDKHYYRDTLTNVRHLLGSKRGGLGASPCGKDNACDFTP